MKQYLLETSAIINFFKNHLLVLDWIRSHSDSEFVSSFVCKAELYEGLNAMKRSTDQKAKLKQLFDRLSKVYGIDEGIAKQFGKLRFGLRTRGELIEDMDILIAATCIEYNLVLVTYNAKHFSRIEGLEVVSF